MSDCINEAHLFINRKAWGNSQFHRSISTTFGKNKNPFIRNYSPKIGLSKYTLFDAAISSLRKEGLINPLPEEF